MKQVEEVEWFLRLRTEPWPQEWRRGARVIITCRCQRREACAVNLVAVGLRNAMVNSPSLLVVDEAE